MTGFRRIASTAPATHNPPVDPLTFTPIYMERIWGGRRLETHYHRTLPKPDAPYGESWDLVDRDPEQSVVDAGPLSGTTLHDLWTKRRTECFGTGYDSHKRFPILIKILDACDDLSIQVHPPEPGKPQPAAEPKTEMWYIADCDPGAVLHMGLKRGVDRNAFRKAIESGTVADCVHAVQPRPGDSVLIPSGRLHAIGKGFLIHEIQQNSDTTYRVFDWNRPGLDGNPRALHTRESMESIRFDDTEPSMDPRQGPVLASCPFFHTEIHSLHQAEPEPEPDLSRFRILCTLDGRLLLPDGRILPPGRLALLPRGCAPARADAAASFLRITLPREAHASDASRHPPETPAPPRHQ
jgi:mannose-6-phosphate isomerase